MSATTLVLFPFVAFLVFVLVFLVSLVFSFFVLLVDLGDLIDGFIVLDLLILRRLPAVTLRVLILLVELFNIVVLSFIAPSSVLPRAALRPLTVLRLFLVLFTRVSDFLLPSLSSLGFTAAIRLPAFRRFGFAAPFVLVSLDFGFFAFLTPLTFFSFSSVMVMDQS